MPTISNSLRPSAGYIPPGAASSANSAPFSSLSSFALSVFLFLTLSRFHEALTVMLGVRAYLFTMSTALVVIAFIMSGRWMVAWTFTPGKLLLAMTAWMIIGMPFGIWRGGTFEVIREEWTSALLTYLMVAAIPSTLRDINRMMFVSGFSLVVVMFMYQRFASVDSGGRVSFAFGTMGNANDFALHLLFGLPFLFFVITDRERTMIVRLASVATALLLLVVLVRTGSRSGLLGLAGLLLAMFWFASMMQKLKLLAAGACIVTVLAATAPESIMRRYMTMVADQNQDNEATLSAEGRKRLLVESIRQTFKRPIFGVGAGNFPVAYAKVMEEQGIMSHRYRASHNTYTQVSSELGLPGFVFFIGIMVWCFWQALGLYRRTRRVPEQEHVARMAFCVFLSLLTFSITTFFGSNAYRLYVPVIAGITVALVRATEHLRVASPAPDIRRGGYRQGGPEVPYQRAPAKTFYRL